MCSYRSHQFLSCLSPIFNLKFSSTWVAEQCFWQDSCISQRKDPLCGLLHPEPATVLQEHQQGLLHEGQKEGEEKPALHLFISQPLRKERHRPLSWQSVRQKVIKPQFYAGFCFEDLGRPGWSFSHCRSTSSGCSAMQASKQIAFNKWGRSMLLLPLLYLTIVLNQKQLKQGLYFDSCICGDMYAQQSSAML